MIRSRAFLVLSLCLGQMVNDLGQLGSNIYVVICNIEARLKQYEEENTELSPEIRNKSIFAQGTNSLSFPFDNVTGVSTMNPVEFQYKEQVMRKNRRKLILDDFFSRPTLGIVAVGSMVPIFSLRSSEKLI